MLIGEAVFAIRLVPAILSGLCVMLLCLIVRKMSGGKTAMVLASLTFLASPQLLGAFTYYSMNSLDVFFWLLAAHRVLCLIERPTLRHWAILGLILGAGMLNKISILWLAVGIFSAILFTDLRSQMKTVGPYLAGLIAIAIFSPFVFWNFQNHFAHLEFMKNAVAEKYNTLTRKDFLAGQFLDMNPFTFLISLPGLYWSLRDREGERFRAIGIQFVTVFGILLANAHTKSEYIAAAYPPLFACGGVFIERASQKRRALAYALGSVLVVTGALATPLTMPILPVETYVRYSRALGVAPSTAEHKELADLPQFFADMHGWESLASDVSRIYLSLPEDERKTTVALMGNYGEAGALELYSKKYQLPRVICAHNSYWLWGVGNPDVTTFIRLGGEVKDYAQNYGEIHDAGIHTCSHCMPYENNLKIFIVRQRRIPIDKAWNDVKHFE
jgi:hypothetical protein